MSLVDQYVCYLEYIIETIHSKCHFILTSQVAITHIIFSPNESMNCLWHFKSPPPYNFKP